MTNTAINIDAIHAYLDRQKFSPPQNEEGRTCVADLYKPSERWYIYVFNFTFGEWYAGQTADLAKRFIRIVKDRLDIKSIRQKIFIKWIPINFR